MTHVCAHFVEVRTYIPWIVLSATPLLPLPLGPWCVSLAKTRASFVGSCQEKLATYCCRLQTEYCWVFLSVCLQTRRTQGRLKDQAQEVLEALASANDDNGDARGGARERARASFIRCGVFFFVFFFG